MIPELSCLEIRALFDTKELLLPGESRSYRNLINLVAKTHPNNRYNGEWAREWAIVVVWRAFELGVYTYDLERSKSDEPWVCLPASPTPTPSRFPPLW